MSDKIKREVKLRITSIRDAVFEGRKAFEVRYEIEVNGRITDRRTKVLTDLDTLQVRYAFEIAPADLQYESYVITIPVGGVQH